ncbi:LytR/AlgR family response regulator transcription factor [Halalkalibacter akibai]|uniref:Transcriptional regulator n=1 Tax=Halalkalibacter akibai (strain ATCC 43226 / DSM 21942 / CIP 109018 / JCM 9157 / 1139) TaxID=1236973 RepID=W4QW88_HALA3|nr:LytTR family DNA-binding domain-containing protein [Halalkalibacter akibai]GAE36167.1 transcriptional regulator [Halalkalibacter akibai JCM 9157]
MKILIAEDDEASRKLLKCFIEMLPQFQVIAEAADGEELIRSVMENKPDIALVDIDMPLLNGLEAVKSCKKLFPSLEVIFTTGHDQYALEAFDVSAVDYIVKPIKRDRLYTALERVEKRLYQSGITSENASKNKDIMIKRNNQITFLAPEEILFIEKLDRKTVIHTNDQKYETNEPLVTYENVLGPRFMTTHRSYLINLDQLTRVETAGRMYKAYFKNYHETARVSKQKLVELQHSKSVSN